MNANWTNGEIATMYHPGFEFGLENGPFGVNTTLVISGFHKATQLFSPNPFGSLHLVCVEMLLLSLLNIPLSSAVVFLLFDLTKHLSDNPS